MDEFFKEELNEAFGEVPQVVEERIIREVRMGMKDTGRKVSMRKVTVLALAAVMVLGTVVFADDIYKIVVKRENYSTKLVNQGESIGTGEDFAQFEYIALKLNYLPDGFTESVRDGGAVKFGNPNEDSISPTIMMTGENSVLAQVRNTKDVKEYILEDRKVYIISRYAVSQTDFDKEGFVFFDNSNYYAHIYMSAGISAKEAEKILSGCTLEGTNESSIAGAYVDSRERICEDSMRLSQKAENAAADAGEEKETDMEYLFSKFKRPGDTVFVENADAQFTLNSYRLLDNIGEYSDMSKFTDDMEDDWFDADGNVLPRHVMIMKSGDGVNTIDEKLGEQNIPVKLLVVNFTVNVKGEPADRVMVAPQLCFDRENTEETYEIGGRRGYDGYPVYNEICIDNARSLYFADLKAGDTVTYELIYFVDEADIDHMGLTFDETMEENWTDKAFDLRTKN